MPSLDPLFQQLAFLKEIDRLKNVMRQSPLLDRSRRENSAEHSWHLAMYAWLLKDYAIAPVNLDRVVKMLLLHDIVEIDAGDTPFLIETAREDAAAIERAAADRIFGLLPSVQRDEVMALWMEFEAAETDDAKFAKAIDRFQPVVANAMTGGGTWNEFPVTEERLLVRYRAELERGAPALYQLAEQWLKSYFEAKRRIDSPS